MPEIIWITARHGSTKNYVDNTKYDLKSFHAKYSLPRNAMSTNIKNMFDYCLPVVDNADTFRGCAFKIDLNTFVTCKHVVEATNNNPTLIIHLASQNQQKLAIENYHYSKDYDLCVLKTKSETQPQLTHFDYGPDLPLGLDVLLLGYTQSPSDIKVIEPRCIKTYIHRSSANPDPEHATSGIYQVNELNVSIPNGFSGGPIVTSNFQLIGMSLGTNISEKPIYLYESEKLVESDIHHGPQTIFVEKNRVEYYGLIHSIKNIIRILEMQTDENE